MMAASPHKIARVFLILSSPFADAAYIVRCGVLRKWQDREDARKHDIESPVYYHRLLVIII
jgi:hypothetical protein